MEHQHNVVSHSLLGNDDLFTTVDHKVPTLVEHALFRISDNFLIIEVPQVAEL